MSGELIQYSQLLTQIKDRILRAQVKATLSANAEMILLYWDIGRMIHERQQREGWGAKVIPKLSRDIRNELPELKGFSERNLKRMIAFYREYPLLSTNVPQLPTGENERIEKVPQPVAQLPDSKTYGNLQQLVTKIPWGHHILLMEKIKDLPVRLWYMHQTIEQGWSRNVLGLMIKSNAFERQGAAVTNFEKRLPDPQSDLARQVLKDPYIFDSLVDDRLKHENDQPTIGLILCQENDRVLAEYALRDIQKPIGVSEYELTRALPDDLKSSLPTVEEIEVELSGEMRELLEGRNGE